MRRAPIAMKHARAIKPTPRVACDNSRMPNSATNVATIAEKMALALNILFLRLRVTVRRRELCPRSSLPHQQISHQILERVADIRRRDVKDRADVLVPGQQIHLLNHEGAADHLRRPEP